MKNIDKIDKFLVICQTFSYQIPIANVAPVTVSPTFYSSNFLNANSSIFSLAKNLHYIATWYICMCACASLVEI